MINSVGGSGFSAIQGSQMQRPDPAQMAGKLFEKLDTKGQGYVEQSDFEAAMSKIGGSAASGGASAEAVFGALDGDGDGKLTAAEFSSSLQKLSDQLDNHRGGMGAAGGMPPPPPPPQGADDAGLDEDQLSGLLEAIQASGQTQGSDQLSALLENFDTADANGDGKINAAEAKSFAQSQQGENTGSGFQPSTEQQVMATVMQLMQTYSVFGDEQAARSGSISVSA